MKRRECLQKIIGVPASLGSGLITLPVTGRPLEKEASPTALSSTFSLKTPPVVQWISPESFEILVLTSDPAFCSVEFRKAGAGKFKTAANHEHGLVEANETWHRITVSGLTPGETVEYRLTAVKIEKFEPYKVHFGPRVETPLFQLQLPEPGDSEVRFTVLNDLHKNIPLIHALMGEVERAGNLPDFMMLNGDVLSHIEGEDDVAAILDLPGEYCSRHPLIWIRGNHECRGNFARSMTRYLPMPNGRYYYTFRRGPVQFLVLDGGEDKNDTDPAYSGLTDFDSYRREEESWFKKILESDEWKKAPFRILVTHIPIGHVPGDEDRDPKFFPPYRQHWAKIMNQAGLDLEISAHYHRYYLEEPSSKRTFPIVIGGGPDEESAVMIKVHATGEILDLEVNNLQHRTVGRKSWRRKNYA